MTLMGCSLNEVKQFINEMRKTKERIRQNEDYRMDVVHHGKNYAYIKKYISVFTSYLRYHETAQIDNLYRVRKCENGNPYKTIKDLKYPVPRIDHVNRMNNISFPVLYTSFHEFTAIAEGDVSKGEKISINAIFVRKTFKDLQAWKV